MLSFVKVVVSCALLPEYGVSILLSFAETKLALAEALSAPSSLSKSVSLGTLAAAGVLHPTRKSG